MPIKDKNKKKKYERDYHRKTDKIRHQEKRTMIYELLGGPICASCGFTDIRALQVDHINGGGNKHRQEIGKSIQALIKAIEKRKQDFQILCANCNWIKRFINNEHANGNRIEE